MARFPDGNRTMVTVQPQVPASVPTTTAAIGDSSPGPEPGGGNVAFSSASQTFVMYTAGAWARMVPLPFPEVGTVIGASTPVPGANDATLCYSTDGACMIRWDGVNWVRANFLLSMGSASGLIVGILNTTIDVTIPLTPTMPNTNYTPVVNASGALIAQLSAAVITKNTGSVVVRVTNSGGTILVASLVTILVIATLS